MKRIVLIGLSALAIVIPNAIAASPAFAANPVRQICSTGPGSPTDACWNNWTGKEANNNPVNYYSSGAIYNNWQVANEGRVVGINCGSNGQPACWPFSDGTGLNKLFNGDTVYLFQWNINPFYCLDGGAYSASNDAGSSKIYQCSTGAPNANQLFVNNTGFGNDSYVNVGASNKGTFYHMQTWPVYEGCASNNCADGRAVLLSGNVLDGQNFTQKGAA